MSNKESDPKLKLPESDSCEVDKIIEELRKKTELSPKTNNKNLPQQKPIVEKIH
jgi:hypothetical protein